MATEGPQVANGPLSSEVCGLLQSVATEVMRRPTVAPDTDLFDAGLTSMMAAQFSVLAAERGCSVGILDLYRFRTPARLATQIAAGATKGVDIKMYDQGGYRFPLSPTASFLHTSGFDTRYNISGGWEYDERLDVTRFAQAVREVVARHPALRLRIERKSRGRLARFVCDEVPSDTFIQIDLRTVTTAAQSAAIEDACERLQAGFTFDGKKPLLRVAVFVCATGAGFLFVLAHHLVIDGYGFNLFLRELDAAYHGSNLVAVPQDPRAWVARLCRYADDEALRELAFWRSLPWDAIGAVRLPQQGQDTRLPAFDDVSAKLLHSAPPEDCDLPEVIEACARQCLVRSALSISHSQTLLALPDGDQVDLVLLAMADALAAAGGARHLWIDSFVAARGLLFEDVDMSRAIGYVNEIAPIYLPHPNDGPLAERLRVVRERRNAAPRFGLGFRALKLLSANRQVRDEAAAWPNPRFGLNYLAALQKNSRRQLLGLPRSSRWTGAEIDESKTPYQACIIASIAGNRVCLDLRHHPRVAHELAQRIAAALLDRLTAHVSASAGARDNMIAGIAA